MTAIWLTRENAGTVDREALRDAARARGVMGRFFQMVCLGTSLDEPATLFDRDAIVHPTAGREATTPAEVREYFANFMAPHRCGKVVTQNIAPVGKNRFLLTGIWQFWHTRTRQGVMRVGEATEARYTMLVGKVGGKRRTLTRRAVPGKWKILYLHSSEDPTSYGVFGA